MKVLVLTSTFPRWPGDTEPRFVDYLCQHLSDNNDIHIVAPHDSGTPTWEQLSPSIQIFRYRYAPQRWQRLAYSGGILPNLRENPARFLLVPFFLAAQLLLVLKLLRRHNYDVIHAHWIIPQGVVARLARALSRRPPPMVLTSHGGDLFALRGKLLGGLKAWVLGGAAAVTVVSSVMRDKATKLGAPGEQLSVIPMGVDTRDTFLPPSRHDQRSGLVFVGRLVDKKGVQYLLQAMPEILAACPGQRLSVIGDGPLRTELITLADSLGIADAVDFRGAVVNEEIPALLAAASIAIIPSVVAETGDQEGAPVSIMETLSCGCPTVVSNYPGARDIIEDGINGFLVDQHAPGQIAQRVIELLQDPELRTRLGQAGRQSVEERFDWRIVSQQFEQVFHDVARGD